MLRLFALLALVAVTGCASANITMKQPGRHDVGSSYSFATSRTWSHISGTPDGWTIEGQALGIMWTWSAVKDGETLFPKEAKKGPAFRANFSPVEVAELVADSIEAHVSGADVETTNFRPMAFGTDDGFRFDFAYVQNGLPRRGMAAGAIRDGKLDLVMFTAPAEYYYDLRATEVESIFRSVKTT